MKRICLLIIILGFVLLGYYHYSYIFTVSLNGLTLIPRSSTDVTVPIVDKLAGIIFLFTAYTILNYGLARTWCGLFCTKYLILAYLLIVSVSLPVTLVLWAVGSPLVFLNFIKEILLSPITGVGAILLSSYAEDLQFRQ
jgi:hypothetical protein